MALDERLRRELEHAGELADPSGVYEHLIRRRERRRMARRVKLGALYLIVLMGTVAGVVLLSRVFATTESTPGAGGGEGILFEDLVDDRYAVYVVQPEGTGLTKLTHGEEAGNASWSPDGSLIVFSRFDTGTASADLFLMAPDGSDVTRLTDTPGISETRARWSPDGTMIAFEAGAESGPLGVYVMDADGTGVHLLTDSTSGAGAPDWSPDGSQIVFNRSPGLLGGTGGLQIWIMDADGGNAHFVTGDQGDPSEASANFGPRWSPNGDRIVFTHDRDIYVVNVDGSGLTNLTPDLGTDFYDRDPAWSSDGRRIVFASTRSHGDSQSLFTMNADGSDVRPVLDQAIGFCCAQPDWRGGLNSAAPTIEPEPTGPTGVSGPDLAERDVPMKLPGVGRACGVTTVEGRFLGNAVTDAYVFEPEPEGGCAGPNEAFQYLGIADPSGRVVVVSDKLTSCLAGIGCWAFAAPDVDRDGISEIAVGIGTTGGSSEFEVYAVAGGVIRRLGFECSNCNASTFAWRRSDGHAEGIYCLQPTASQDFVMWNAERTDAGDRYSVVELTIDVKGSFLTQTDRRDSVVPYDTTALPAGGGDDFCGTPVSPPPGP